MNNNSSTGSQVQGSGNASQWAGVHLGFYQASAMETCILFVNFRMNTSMVDTAPLIIWLL
jgi:hypothetical protein